MADNPFPLSSALRGMDTGGGFDPSSPGVEGAEHESPPNPFDNPGASSLAQFSNSLNAQRRVRAAMKPVLQRAMDYQGDATGSPRTAQAANQKMTHAKLMFKPLYRSQPYTIPGTKTMAPDPEMGLTTDQVQTVRNRAYFAAATD